ncbi:undecaprenyl-diphosphate phosphatase [Streptococcus hillyeri]|uniref:Undecaprenyl-diphosphatase n=1 Tax=Streptococcus hillyeri TaxID=2282420 RepID=A0A3L9DQ70_9STRE|nr:undecaprenyl-diphosphate phosphatase [Streptococcus hillyeri]RLY03616.1 undecaprenyl-diphosphate phosphatase [Streptococcus hillyeri]
MFFEMLKAIFFGIVEGITEWLPISSTGHLILVQEFINFSNQNKDFMDMFNIVIQLGAILAVIVIYFKRLNPFQPGKSAKEVQKTWQLWVKVAIACVPSILIALPLDDWFESHFQNMPTVALMLIVYGVAFILLEDCQQMTPKVDSLSKMSYKTALYIGMFQVLSIVPGTSRSGATILGGILLGTSRSVAADFTFFLAIPTMFGYSGLKAVKFFIDGNTLVFSQIVLLLLASLTAFVVSYYAIRFLTDYVKSHTFKIFGKYRIVLGLILLAYTGLSYIF